MPWHLVLEASLPLTVVTRDERVRYAALVQLSGAAHRIRTPDELRHLLQLSLRDIAIVPIDELDVAVQQEDVSDFRISEFPVTVKLWTIYLVGESDLKFLQHVLCVTRPTDRSRRMGASVPLVIELCTVLIFHTDGAVALTSIACNAPKTSVPTKIPHE